MCQFVTHSEIENRIFHSERECLKRDRGRCGGGRYANCGENTFSFFQFNAIRYIVKQRESN